MKYVISGLKGAFIAIVCGVLLTLYFGGEIDFESMTLILVYGFVQGAMSKLIDDIAKKDQSHKQETDIDNFQDEEEI